MKIKYHILKWFDHLELFEKVCGWISKNFEKFKKV